MEARRSRCLPTTPRKSQKFGEVRRTSSIRLVQININLVTHLATIG